MRVKRYVFSYALDGYCYDPCSPTFYVRALNIRDARVKAQQKLVSLINQEGREKWVWESSSFDQEDGKWVHYPARQTGGHLIGRGRAVQPFRRRRFDGPFTFPVNVLPAESAQALAALVSAPILQIIQQAPVFAERFAGAPVDTGEDTSFSIPIIYAGKTVYRQPAAARRPTTS